MTSRAKILIISDAWLPQLNGVVRTYQALGESLKARGYAVRVIGPHDFPRRFAMPGYKEIELAVMPYRRLVQLIEAEEPDAIHIATEGPLGWAARKYCLRHRVDFTSCYHTRFPEYVALRARKVLPFLYKPFFKLGVAVVRKFHAPSVALFVTTKTMAEQLEGFGVKPRLKILTRGVDAGIFHCGEKTLFKELKQPVALYVGRLAVEKNIEEFLDMEWLGSKVVVGHGPDEEKLRKQYPDAVFTGKKEGATLADHYRSADVFVFPSRTDTFGIVLIEALACGLPIAAHDVAGPCDIVMDGNLGVLSEDLSQAAQEAVACGSAKERNEYVSENYSWDIAVEQFLRSF